MDTEELPELPIDDDAWDKPLPIKRSADYQNPHLQNRTCEACE